MAEEMESVKVSASTMATIREWAAATNRNVSGMVDRILSRASQDYLEGRGSGLDSATELVKGKKQ